MLSIWVLDAVIWMICSFMRVKRLPGDSNKCALVLQLAVHEQIAKTVCR
jgi:hypothetical protein